MPILTTNGLGADSEGDYDMTVYDDHGQRLMDDNGHDPKLEYDEGSACYSSAWAGSYRDVRGQLQATKKAGIEK
eukprot:3220041-Karenia_brevis.AAC.1